MRPDCYGALLSAIVLAKCFQAQLWEDSVYISRQLPGIGPVLSKALVNRGKTSFEIIENCNPREIEIVCSIFYG